MVGMRWMRCIYSRARRVQHIEWPGVVCVVVIDVWENKIASSNFYKTSFSSVLHIAAILSSLFRLSAMLARRGASHQTTV